MAAAYHSLSVSSLYDVLKNHNYGTSKFISILNNPYIDKVLLNLYADMHAAEVESLDYFFYYFKEACTCDYISRDIVTSFTRQASNVYYGLSVSNKLDFLNRLFKNSTVYSPLCQTLLLNSSLISDLTPLAINDAQYSWGYSRDGDSVISLLTSDIASAFFRPLENAHFFGFDAATDMCPHTLTYLHSNLYMFVNECGFSLGTNPIQHISDPRMLLYVGLFEHKMFSEKLWDNLDLQGKGFILSLVVEAFNCLHDINISTVHTDFFGTRESCYVNNTRSYLTETYLQQNYSLTNFLSLHFSFFDDRTFSKLNSLLNTYSSLSMNRLSETDYVNLIEGIEYNIDIINDILPEQII